MFQNKGYEPFTHLLLTGHYRLLLPGIMHIIPESVIICREKVAYYFFLIWVILPPDNIAYHRITGHECLQGFLVDGIEMVGFEGESLLKTDRKVERLESGEPMIQDTQSGFGAIIGYEFANGLAIDVSYRLCCFNILQPNTSQGVSMYPQSVSLGLAYKFGKK